jgi:ATPase family associated with various cellular activities (AAA)
MNSNDKSNNSDQDLHSILIQELRQMRTDALRLNSGVVEHMRAFQQEDDSFRTLPSSKPLSEDLDISVGSTCTAFMALLATKTHKEFLSKRVGVPTKTKVDFAELFRRLVSTKWDSSGLPDGNAFTTALVVRTAGFVVKNKILLPEEVGALKHGRHSTKNEEGINAVDETVADKPLLEIIQSRAKGGGESFAVSKYPAKATIVYWFLDGAINAGASIDDYLPEIASWATREFNKQLIYVSAGNDALMDPPELAMAACLIKRIHRLCNDRPELAKISRSLPSEIELTFAVERVISEQSRSGIWHRYFPLFHFPLGRGAADYCFSFEFLEAVLGEFGSAVLRTRELLSYFRRSLTWCDSHVLHFVKSKDAHYRGWNSGGEVRTLADGMPEAWATASVHMFLSQLHRKISDLLDQLVLAKFGFDRIATVPSKDDFKGLIDIKIEFPGEPSTWLLTVLEDELIDNAMRSMTLDDFTLGVPRSALFFGPPGTSKTNLAKSIAAYVGWPIVIITPSHFLGKGLEQVHAQVDEVFRDLMDLRKVVVLFDEMDALAQTREEDPEAKSGESLDVTRQLLTTSMLPKLSDLWNKAGVVFLMATNHKQHLDPAITRANRFDLLLCVAPPPWTAKRSADKLDRILKIVNAAEVEKELERLVPEASQTEELLGLFTVSELGIFFDYLRRKTEAGGLASVLNKYRTASEFSTVVTKWAKSVMALREGTPARAEYDKDVNESRRQYYRKEKEKPESNALPPTGQQARVGLNRSPKPVKTPAKRKHR